MEDSLLLDAVDRYLRMEMTQQERIMFEEMRRTNPEVDQLVVAHAFFVQELEKYGRTKDFKSSLHEVEAHLVEEGLIRKEKLGAGAKIINMWRRSKRTITVAASIGGITALCISGMVALFSPKPNASIQELSRKMERLENSQKAQSQQLNEVKSKIDPKAEQKSGGTGFLIDGKGFLVTNAHVIKNVSSIYVQNRNGYNFKASILYINLGLDLAILKIDDPDFKPLVSLPYGIKKGGVDLGEQIFTLGYPKNEIVYGEGYMSARTGFDGDTMSCQIAVSANPGNSGGPVLNHNGEVIGILSTKQVQADGVVFAVKARNIFSVLEQMKKDSARYPGVKIKMPSSSAVRGLDRHQQISKIEDCVYMVKGY